MKKSISWTILIEIQHFYVEKKAKMLDSGPIDKLKQLNSSLFNSKPFIYRIPCILGTVCMYIWWNSMSFFNAKPSHLEGKWPKSPKSTISATMHIQGLVGTVKFQVKSFLCPNLWSIDQLGLDVGVVALLFHFLPFLN